MNKTVINITFYTLIALSVAWMALSIYTIGLAHSTPAASRTQTQMDVVEYYENVAEFLS